LTTSPLKISKTDTVIQIINTQTTGNRVDRRAIPKFNTSQVINEYSFNAAPIGLFLVHETKNISVRVHGSVGYASNYFGNFLETGISDFEVVQQNDIFFSGRAWITEPKSGITLEAEVTNSFFNSRPFFVATLSKAFDFKDLGSVFSPITTRK
jgi:hypothetical protein